MLEIMLVDRPGQQNVTLANESLRDLVKFSHLTGAEMEFITFATSYGLYTKNGAITPNEMFVPLKFNLGGVVDLRGGQGRIVVRWTVQSSVFTAEVDTAASYFTIDAIEVDEAEYDLPITKSFLVEPSQDKPRIDMGDNVREISILNHDKADIFESTAALINFNLKALNYNRADDYLELLNKNVAQYTTTAEFLTRYQNFDIYKSSDDLDNVVLEPVFAKANITTGNNIVMWRSFIRTDYHVTRGALVDARKEARLGRKGSFNKELAKTL